MTDLSDVNIKDLLEKNDSELRAELEAMLPKPTYPEHMLGLWAQHPEHGRVLVVSDGVFDDGSVPILYAGSDGTNPEYVPVSELTFPHQVTEGELPTETLYNTLSWGSGGLSIIDKEDGQEVEIDDEELAQLGYAMLAYAGEPQLAPEYVETEEEYEALPPGSIVADDMDFPLIKRDTELWYESGSTRSYSNFDMSYSRRRVLRRGWRHE